MSKTGYEIRQSLLMQAKDVLFEQWYTEKEIELITAEKENRVPKLTKAPTIDEIKSMAESLYEFVQRK